MWSQKNIHTFPVVIGNSEGVGVSIAKVFNGKYEAKLKFPLGWSGVGVQIKNLLWDGYGYLIYLNSTLFLLYVN